MRWNAHLSAALTSAALALLSVACGRSEPNSTEPPIAELYAGADAVRPYTVETLRRGSPVGRETLTRLETANTVYIRARILEVDDDGYLKETTMLDEAREPLFAPTSRRRLWQDEVDGVSYRRGSILTTEERLTTELGTFDCWHYVTVSEEGWREHTWYAKRLPGSPILLETRSRNGTRLRRVTRVEDSRLSPK